MRFGVRPGFIFSIAGLAPALAVAFAFSLGPSPRKVIDAVERAHAEPEVAVQAFRDGPAGIDAVLSERLAQPDFVYRAEAAQVLGEHRYRPALRVLRQLMTDPGCPPDLERAARSAAARFPESWWTAVLDADAESLL